MSCPTDDRPDDNDAAANRPGDSSPVSKGSGDNGSMEMRGEQSDANFETLIEDIEVDLLIDAIRRRYGYDFGEYARSSLTRRLCRAVKEENLSSLSMLQHHILRSPEAMARLVDNISVSMTAMFRDPEFFAAFRQRIIPELKTYPRLRIWMAGCATGEEVYSVAILLIEAGLYERCRIYATDVSERALEQAQTGVMPLSAMRQYTRNYLEAGGNQDFSSYYTTRYDSVLMKDSIKGNITFSRHSLASDSSFNEFHVILCRNVMIYFEPELRNRVHLLLADSLRRLGFLGIGSRETLRFGPIESSFQQLPGNEKWYRKQR